MNIWNWKGVILNCWVMLQIELRTWFVHWITVCRDGNSKSKNWIWTYVMRKKQNTFPDTYTSIAKPVPSVVFPGFINRWRELNNRQKLLPLPCSWLEEILWSNSYYDGSLPWLRCACSARSEKPKEAKRCPLWTPGSKTCQHGIVAGVFPFPESVGWPDVYSGTSLILSP